MRSPIYNWSRSQPFHISVGVVLTDKEGRVCAHHFRPGDEGERYWAGMGTAQEYYLLMRESVEDGESLADTALRGIREEFGATGTVRRFLGTTLSTFPVDDMTVEKTTLYFHVECDSLDESLKVEDSESASEIVWLMPQELIGHMERLGAQMERTDRNESKIIHAYLRYQSQKT